VRGVTLTRDETSRQRETITGGRSMKRTLAVAVFFLLWAGAAGTTFAAEPRLNVYMKTAVSNCTCTTSSAAVTMLLCSCAFSQPSGCKRRIFRWLSSGVRSCSVMTLTRRQDERCGAS
jgi:hypothetical protein